MSSGNEPICMREKLYMYICIYNMTFIRDIILMCIYTYIYIHVCVFYIDTIFCDMLLEKEWFLVFTEGHHLFHPSSRQLPPKSQKPYSDTFLLLYSIPSSLAWWFNSKGCNFWFHCFNKKSLEIAGASLPGTVPSWVKGRRIVLLRRSIGLLNWFQVNHMCENVKSHKGTTPHSAAQTWALHSA